MAFVSPGQLSTANHNSIFKPLPGQENPFTLSEKEGVVEKDLMKSMSRRAKEMFCQDSMIESEAPCNYSQIRQPYPKVNWVQFLEVFACYCIFVFLSGPLTFLLLGIKPGICFLKNIHLSPVCGRFYGFSIFFIVNWLTYFYLKLEGEPSFVSVIVHYILTIIFLAMESFTYATYDERLYKAMRVQKFCDTYVNKECLINGPWLKDDIGLFYEELLYTLQRVEVDLSMFYMNFTINLPTKLVTKLQYNIETLSAFHQRKSLIFQPSCLISFEAVTMIYAHAVLLEFFDVFRRRNYNRNIRIVSLVIFFIISGFSTALTFYPATHWTPLEITVKLLLIVCKSICCAFFGMYLLVLRKDLKRRLFFLVQMSYLMLSQKRLQEFEEEILIPNLNIFCPMNLKCWQNLRSVTQDLGKRYFLRHDLNISLCLLLFLGSLTLLALSFFNVVVISPDEVMIISTKSIILFVIIVSVMMNGAYVNEHFRLHKSILERGKGICTDLYRLDKYYFDEKTIPQNFMYRFGVGIMRVNYGNDQNRINQHLENLIGIFNNGIIDLKHDEVYKPFMLLGITISLPLMKSIIFGLLSLLLAALQEFIKRAIRK